MDIYNIFNKYMLKKSELANSAPESGIQGKTSDGLLAELCVYGDPKLVKMDTGWWCFIEAAGAVKGTRFTIYSGNEHTHPAHAISECLTRLKASGLQHLSHSKVENPNRSSS